jgi:PIN domain nuclease of toxin-antitoxin system
VKLLLDTHILIWMARDDRRLTARHRALLEDDRHQPYFSAASLWEISIKAARRKADFNIDPERIYDGLLASGCVEVPVRSAHTIAVTRLPPLHGDPFDRLLIAQAIVEAMTLLTADSTLARYESTLVV